MTKINVDTDFLDHPKTRRLQLACGPEADIYPVRLWIYAARHYPKDGILTGHSAKEIEGILKWRGAESGLIGPLETLGFVEKFENDFRVHDWKKHAWFVWHYKEAGRKGGVNSGKSRRSKNEPPFKQTPNPPSSKPPTPLEQLNGMELNGMELNKDVSLEPGSSPGSQAVVVMTFPTTGKPAEYRLLENKVAEYQQTFPGLDVLAQMRMARQWCADNPTKRKTSRGMERFLGAWLERSQNRGGPRVKESVREVVG